MCVDIPIIFYIVFVIVFILLHDSLACIVPFMYKVFNEYIMSLISLTDNNHSDNVSVIFLQ